MRVDEKNPLKDENIPISVETFFKSRIMESSSVMIFNRRHQDRHLLFIFEF